MANKKISELTELRSPQSTDSLPIVDGSDSSTKKVKLRALQVAPDGSVDDPGFKFISGGGFYKATDGTFKTTNHFAAPLTASERTSLLASCTVIPSLSVTDSSIAVASRTPAPTSAALNLPESFLVRAGSDTDREVNISPPIASGRKASAINEDSHSSGTNTRRTTPIPSTMSTVVMTRGVFRLTIAQPNYVSRPDPSAIQVTLSCRAPR